MRLETNVLLFTSMECSTPPQILPGVGKNRYSNCSNIHTLPCNIHRLSTQTKHYHDFTSFCYRFSELSLILLSCRFLWRDYHRIVSSIFVCVHALYVTAMFFFSDIDFSRAKLTDNNKYIFEKTQKI